MPTITPFLWFDGQAEAAAAHYVSVFPNSAVRHVSRYGGAGRVMEAVMRMRKIDVAALERAAEA